MSKSFAIGTGLNVVFVLVKGFCGWRRGSVLAAFINAVLLLVAMGSLGWKAITRLGAPEATEGWTVIWIAAIGIGINTATALLFMRGGGKDLNILPAHGGSCVGLLWSSRGRFVVPLERMGLA